MSAATEASLAALVSLLAKGLESGRIVIEIRTPDAADAEQKAEDLASQLINAKPKRKRCR